MLAVNGGMLLLRLVSRFLFTTRIYGVRHGLLSAPRLLVGNIIDLIAARRAVARYVSMLAGARPVCDKTAHVFPEAATLESR